MTTKLAAVGVASASLTIPAASAFALPAAKTGDQPGTVTVDGPTLTIDGQTFTADDQPIPVEALENMTWISGEEADRLGISGKIPETRPELPDGVVPPEFQSSEALAAATTSCPSGKQCMWTGGYYAGPGRSLNGGHSATYWSWAEAKCAGSGNPAGNWKNCASSLRNDNIGFGFTVYNNSVNEDVGSYKNVPQQGARPELGTFNNNIEKSVGFGN